MAVQNPLLDIFTGGQMTDLPSYPGGIDLTALFEIVSPGSAAAGVNYNITSAALAALLNGAQFASPTFVLSGATYNSAGTDTRILVNKTVGSATSVVLLSSASYSQPVLVKDLKGDAGTNNITITFSGGQLFDGLSSIVINNPYGYIWLNPLAAGGWYDAAN
jgi:hypothetical protein